MKINGLFFPDFEYELIVNPFKAIFRNIMMDEEEIKRLEERWLKKKRNNEYRKEHKKQNNIAHREYWKKNKDKINAHRKDMYWKNHDKIVAKLKRYYETHPEAKQKRDEKQREWIIKNKDRIRAYNKLYFSTHPQKSRTQKIICGLECPNCGFQIKTRIRNGRRKRTKCPACRKTYSPSSMKRIRINRKDYQGVSVEKA